MKATFKPYPKYKPSGVEWLGDIPEHWELKRLGQLFRERKETVSDVEYPPLSVTKNGIVPQMESVAKTSAGDKRKKICKGDFAINSRSDRKGSSGLSAYDGSTSAITIVLRPTEANGQYCHHLMRSYGFQEEFYRWGKGIVADLWSTRFSEMSNILLPSPPSQECQAVANFLNEETRQIDVLLKELEESISLLEEEIVSNINELVTGKVNPYTGKPYPKYKPSGVEWLGDIPEHWEVKPLFALATERGESNKGLVEKNLLSLSYGRIKRKDISAREGLLPESFETYQIVHKGDLVFRLTDLQNDKRSLRSGLVEETGIITSAYLAIHPTGVSSEYLSQLCRSYDISKVFYSMGGGLRQSLKYAEMKRLPILVPSSRDQETISSFLSNVSTAVDPLIAEKESLIESLKEYRTSLIHEAVTGKIDLRKKVA
jgi:type I restriction enzyme S subunit